MTIDLTNTTTGAIREALTRERKRLGGQTTGMVLNLIIMTDESAQYDAVRAASQAAREHLAAERRAGRSARTSREGDVADVPLNGGRRRLRLDERVVDRERREPGRELRLDLALLPAGHRLRRDLVHVDGVVQPLQRGDVARRVHVGRVECSAERRVHGEERGDRALVLVRLEGDALLE